VKDNEEENESLETSSSKFFFFIITFFFFLIPFFFFSSNENLLLGSQNISKSNNLILLVQNSGNDFPIPCSENRFPTSFSMFNQPLRIPPSNLGSPLFFNHLFFVKIIFFSF
jgi:hypothetical protein